MPSSIDPKVAAATVALKRSQTRLTTLRRKHLEGDYLERELVESFIVSLATDFRQKVLDLPNKIRLGLPDRLAPRDMLDIEDAIEKVCDAWLLEFSRPDMPQPNRIKGGYTSKPGPKKRGKSAKMPSREEAE